MLRHGVHPMVAADMLGHSTVAITLDLYSHSTEPMRREAADILEGVVRGACNELLSSCRQAPAGPGRATLSDRPT